MTDTDMQQILKQLEILVAGQARMEARLDVHDKRLEQLDERFVQIDKTLSSELEHVDRQIQRLR
jgi:hypothetical protein